MMQIDAWISRTQQPPHHTPFYGAEVLVGNKMMNQPELGYNHALLQVDSRQ